MQLACFETREQSPVLSDGKIAGTGLLSSFIVVDEIQLIMRRNNQVSVVHGKTIESKRAYGTLLWGGAERISSYGTRRSPSARSRSRTVYSKSSQVGGERAAQLPRASLSRMHPLDHLHAAASRPRERKQPCGGRRLHVVWAGAAEDQPQHKYAEKVLLAYPLLLST